MYSCCDSKRLNNKKKCPTPKKGGGEMNVHDSTLEDESCDAIGFLGFFEIYASHLTLPCDELNNMVTQLDLLIREGELIRNLMRGDPNNNNLGERSLFNKNSIAVVIDRLKNFDLSRDINCSYRVFYEVASIGVKNKLMEIQGRIKNGKKIIRNGLVERCMHMNSTFRPNSEQAHDAREALLNFDDNDLNDRACKFRDFLDENNEKATSAFCRLSKEMGGNSDTGQIKNGDGIEFENEKARGEFIGGYYSELYKKKAD